MTDYTHATAGTCFVLTETGKKIGRIKSKFDPKHPTFKKAYRHCVPTAWVIKGLVKEEKE